VRRRAGTGLSWRLRTVYTTPIARGKRQTCTSSHKGLAGSAVVGIERGDKVVVHASGRLFVLALLLLSELLVELVLALLGRALEQTVELPDRRPASVIMF
jgi:hypothetical protein